MSGYAIAPNVAATIGDQPLWWGLITPSCDRSLGFAPFSVDGTTWNSVRINAGLFSAVGTVIMDARVPSDTYELGFVQNVVSSDATATYVDDAGNPVCTQRIWVDGTPCCDSLAADAVPWVRKNATISVNDQQYLVNHQDRPTQVFLLEANPKALNGGVATTGKLKSVSGEDHFLTWLVLREKSTGKLNFTYWVHWAVDWGCSFSPTTKDGTMTGAGTQIIDRGEGQGALVPVVAVPPKVANAAIQVGPVTPIGSSP